MVTHTFVFMCFIIHTRLCYLMETVVGADRIAQNGDTANKVGVLPVVVVRIADFSPDRHVQCRGPCGTTQHTIRRCRAY